MLCGPSATHLRCCAQRPRCCFACYIPHLWRGAGERKGCPTSFFAPQIQPNDYSLWNKLGATLANSSRSGEALSAYQKALDLKPNYMRAWTNLGISYSNLGKYIEAAKYYLQVCYPRSCREHRPCTSTCRLISLRLPTTSAAALQALELNPSAVDVWSYLKTAVLCAGRTDLMPSLSNSDLRAIRAGLLES